MGSSSSKSHPAAAAFSALNESAAVNESGKGDKGGSRATPSQGRD